MLATVHEDTELTETPLPLTRDMLLVTQKRRATELRPKPEAYAGYVSIIVVVFGMIIPY